MSDRRKRPREETGGSGRAGNSGRNRITEITDAAAEIFRQRGYSETSVHEIAESVGILKGSLYYYIDSKEDLLFQMLSAVHDDAAQIVEGIQALELPAIEKLRTYVTRHVEYNTRNVTRIAVFYHDYRSLSPDRRKEIVARRKYFEEFLQSLIREAQDEGSIDSGVDPKMASYALFGMMNWVYHWYRSSGPWKPDELAEFYADFAISGLTGMRRGGRSKGPSIEGAG